jgi:hypothetical protein
VDTPGGNDIVTTEVDGVPVHHLGSTDEVCTATLIFGVGSRDESLPTSGVLHALEHVVMDAAKDTAAEIDASVGPSETEFVVSGTPPRVADFLARVCRGLADPPTARLQAEAPIIAAELDGSGGPDLPLLAARYGFRDLGTTAMDGPGPDGLTEQQLLDVAATWFVAGNAALLVDGPLPRDLRLPLRPGRPSGHRRVGPRRWAGPHAIRIEAPACAVSVLLPPQTADRLDLLAVEVMDHRLRETLRHRDGLTYVVEHLIHPVGDDRQDVLLVAEPPEARLVPAVTGLVTELRRLLRDGATAAELERARTRVVEGRLGRAGVLEERRVAVIDHLLGVTSFPVPPSRLAEATLDGLNRYLADLESDLLFLVADEPDLELGRLDLPETTVEPTTTGPLPPGEVFRPPLLTRAISSAARQATVVLTATGVAARLEGLNQRIDWDGVAGLVVDEDDLLLCGLDGAVIPLAESAYRGGRELVARVRARVPERLTFRRSALLGRDDEDPLRS